MSEAIQISTEFPDPYAVPLDKFELWNGALYEQDKHWAFFERLRKEAPVHYTAESPAGPFWSVTKYQDIMSVDTHHEIYSSEGSITIDDQDPEFTIPMFIAMDPPKHDVQRMTVSPVVAPANLALLEGTIRERVIRILESLPRDEPFNWVQHVSIELTTQMLATLFDFPWEDRHLLTYWSDLATADLNSGLFETEDEQRAELLKCLEYFTRLWNERVNEPGGNDLISMLAHGESTRNMDPMEYLGNLVLLIVGGNDTTRNSISGGVLALNQNPAEYDKLRKNPSLIGNMVPEIIRWQSPVAHMARTALEDTELGGKPIKKGERVAMWYISGNRDEDKIPNANQFMIDRPNARHHLSFGFGIHRCLGNRLGEMQLRVIWEELMKRYPKIDVVGDPKFLKSSFIHGIRELPVRIPG